MSYRPRPAAKLPLAAGCALAALLSTPLAMAQSEAAPLTLQGHRVVIDAVTGRPRMPEADELATMQAGSQRAAARSAAAAAPSSGTGVESHPAMKRMQSAPTNIRLGAVGQRFDMSTLSFSVVRREAGGKLATQCVTGEDAAAHAAHNHVEGDQHDR